jgi:aquaporin Z
MKIIRSALYGEFLGTYAMVFCGTAAMAVNEINGSISHVGVAITWGLIVMAMIYAFGELSGAHFNPAVTVGFALSGRFAWKNVPIYIVMQVIAAT